MSKSLLIIGGSGFFGKSIIDYINYNGVSKSINKVLVLSRGINKIKIKKEINSKIKIETLKADISKLKKIPFADYVIYCAINYNFDQDYKSVCNYYKLAKKYHSKSKILYTSSGAVYGQQPKRLKKLNENYLFNNERIDFKDKNKNFYSIIKLKNEEIFKQLSKYNIKISIARCFAFVGKHLPRDKNFVVGNLIENVLKNRKIVIKSNYKVIRSYMHENDLVNWLLKIVKNSNKSCPIYNVGSDQGINIRRLGLYLSKKYSLPIKFKKKIFSFEDRYLPSIYKAKTKLGLRLKYNCLNGIDEVIDSIKKTTNISS